MARGDFGVVGDGATDLEAAGDFLRMVAVGAGLEREIRRAAENEVEALVGVENAGIAKIALADVVAREQAVVSSGFSCQGNAFGLGFDGDEVCERQAPGGGHADGTNAAAEVKYAAGGGTPAGAVPGCQHVVGGKTMAALELEDAKVAAEGIDRFAFRRSDVLDVFDVGQRSGNCPATECGFNVTNIGLFLGRC